ncbi:MAG: hypothetical protein JXB32_24915 [Deltaproteobacteria bacterium]|nr:hypothetical protein [Deltaproteobacteria bacterium]
MRAIVPLIVVLVGCGSVVVDDDCDDCDGCDAEHDNTERQEDAPSEEHTPPHDDAATDTGADDSDLPHDAADDATSVACTWDDWDDWSGIGMDGIVASVVFYLVPGTTLSLQLAGTANTEVGSEGPCDITGPPGDYECTPTEDGRSTIWVSIEGWAPYEYHVTAAGTCRGTGTP